MRGNDPGSAATSLTDRARAIWCSLISPTVAAAFETYPEKDVAEILEMCAPALVRDLAWELEDACRQFAAETFRRPRIGGSDD